jgi:PAS domain S-box-containing protein
MQWVEYRFNPIRDHTGQITGVTVFGRDITERKVAEESQREQEERFRLAFENANDGVCLVGLDGHLLRVNARMGEIFGYSSQELQQMTVNDLAHPDYLETSTRFINQAVHGHNDHKVFEKLYLHRDGHRVWGQVSSSLVRNDRGDPLYFISHVQDITERKRIEREREQLQAQLMQAQKMEVIGRLAGGIAHDFNNMLAVMMLRTEMAMQLVDASSLLHRNLAGVYATGQRSANLVRQLLGFARKQTIAPEPLDLNAVVAGALPMLRKLIEEGIEVVWQAGANLWPIRMDPSQIDQILTNLCVNASDAIGSVGTITIETKNIELDQGAVASGLSVSPGEYVMLVVNDTGSGMDEKTLAHIFEPFFTTKEIGKGTGLGLATVEGIVQQNEGQVRVYSKPGIGTAFQIYLPRYAGAMAEQPEEPTLRPQARVRGQGEMVLLVEDEAAVLQMGAEALQHLGYQVISAATPGEALALAKANAGHIALLITDVIMPEMNGGDLARQIASIQPNIRQLFVSGYSADFITRRGMLEEDMHFLQKPFSLATLAQKVRDALA